MRLLQIFLCSAILMLSNTAKALSGFNIERLVKNNDHVELKRIFPESDYENSLGSIFPMLVNI